MGEWGWGEWEISAPAWNLEKPEERSVTWVEP